MESEKVSHFPINPERAKTMLSDNNLYSQKELSSLLSISESEFSKWMLGERNIPQTALIKICKIMFCNPAWLLGIDDHRTPTTAKMEWEIAEMACKLTHSIRSALHTLLAFLTSKESAHQKSMAIAFFCLTTKHQYSNENKTFTAQTEPPATNPTEPVVDKSRTDSDSHSDNAP